MIAMNAHVLQITVLMSLFMTIAACHQSPSDPPFKPTGEIHKSDPHSVPFDVEPVDATGSTRAWRATYSSQGKSARFRIEFGAEKMSKAKDAKDFGFAYGNGRFVAEPGSDASVLLQELKKALAAKVVPTSIQRVSSLSFTYVNFGEDLSQADGGGFTADRRGNWSTNKIFIGEGIRKPRFF